ncbi:MAG: NADH-quinone oxidoreductase subunit G [Bifidobacteriaceae bacterium]|jgi:NADH-quinone oxidoreductase subunit G|nr:NADH-quinone oxidoreductase subunit G [Bifidobacteriaceae bacterium]
MSAEDLVTCSIDGIEIAVPKNTLIIRAAEEAGVMIPRFCDHPLLAPVAACRQCLVDVASPAGPEGKLRAFPKPQPACAMTVTPGMVVNTQLTSAAAKTAQEQVAELILINHPLDCPICDKGGECPLQNQAMSTGRSVSRFTEKKNTFPKPLALTAQILLDRERCVLCQRCTRFAAQIPGDPFIALQRRGVNQQIGRFDASVLGVAAVADEAADEAEGDVLAVDGTPFAGYFAGNIIQICPVGALTSAEYRFRARPFDLVSTATVAEHDSTCSAIRVDYRRGQVLRRLAGDDPELNQEWITDKDRFGFHWQTAPDRLRRPLVRRGDDLVEVSWPEGLAAAAEVLGSAKRAAVLPGGRLTLEDAHAYAVFARAVLKTDSIDFRARPSSPEEAQFLAHFAAGAGTGVSLNELAAAPAVLLVGFEAEDEGGIVYLRLREAGTTVYALAPFASRGLARLGGTLLPTLPGAEASALAKLSDAAGPVPEPGASAKGPTSADAVQTLTASAAAALAGGVIVLGERLATSPGAYSAAVAAAERLGAKLVWIPRRAGERAALEAGLLPGLAPGGRALGDLTEAETTMIFGGPLDLEPGLDLPGIVAAVRAGEIDTVLVGGLELVDLPVPPAAATALKGAKVVALQVRGEGISPWADVVLPVAPPQEKAGTFINWEGRLRPFPQVLTSTALSDGKVLQALAAKLGFTLGIGELATVHQVLDRLGPAGRRQPAPAVAPPEAPALGAGEALLSTWHQLVDDAAGLDGEPRLAASAPAPKARLNAATAQGVGARAGDDLQVSTAAGAVTLPVVIDDLPNGVVHLPTKSPGSWVRVALNAANGDVVRIAASSGAKEAQP